MKKFKQYIAESFDKPYKYSLKKEDDMEYYGEFKLDDGSDVEVMFEGTEHADDYEHTKWSIEFKRNGRQSETGEGDALRIFATVIKMIEDFLKKEKPKYLSFSALKPFEKEDRKEKQSREKLYSRLVKRFSGKLGYTVDEVTFSSGTEWNLTRKKMIKFNQFIIEQKNTHMEHIEDLIFNEGVVGTRKAINFLRDLRDMLAGHSKSSISRTVKWDGAPAVFAGIDPSDGKFFVAKKGVFNKNPKVYKTEADVKADTSGDLQSKLITALQEFSKLGVKKGVYQGDLMFTKGDVGKENIDGESYFTFQPNTIVYAVPVKSDLGRTISKANIGVVWHTTYTGNSFESMSASFGKDIVGQFKNVSSIWQTDANYRDETGNATFTQAETTEITQILSEAGKLFNKIPAGLINAFSEDKELLDRVKVFNNTFVRAGRPVNPRNHTRAFIDYLDSVYRKDSDKLKRPDSKAKVELKKKNIMTYFSKYSISDWTNLWTLMNTLVQAKGMIISKMNQAGSIGTFLRTRSGFKVTAPEGFVAIDHLSNDAVKIVDRLEFSKANFSADVIKGWEK